jgi:hypothetical protein
MKLPDFLIIGAQKAGTTALHHFLDQHPDIYMCPVKETNFFAMEGRPVAFEGPGDREALARNALVTTITDLDAYARLFEDARAGQIVGEACPMYLYSDRAPERIAERLPGVKLIAVLRNPAARAFSAYTMLRQAGRETASFDEALHLEPERTTRNWEYAWHYAGAGRYAAQLERYFRRFPAEQIRVYLHEDLVASPDRVVNDILAFLGADKGHVINTSERHNVSGIPRSRLLHRILSDTGAVRAMARAAIPRAARQAAFKFAARKNSTRPTIDPAARERITEALRPDIERLSHLIERDLSHWLTAAA